MKHDRFIELLNLYLDGEISQQESADLEREITQNPERRKIYRQYCQMQRACNMLAEKFRDAAETPAASGDNVIAFPAKPAATHWARSLSLVASGAVAACFVFIVVRSGLSPSTPDRLPASTQSLASNPAPLLREQTIPVTSFASTETLPSFRLNAANPGDFAAAAGAVPVSAQPGRHQSLFHSVPPLPNHPQPMLPAVGEFPRDVRPELQVENPLYNAIQFPR